VKDSILRLAEMMTEELGNIRDDLQIEVAK
jgi:hypothetical protein